MSYSSNIYTLRKIEAQLAPLTVGRSCRWEKPIDADARWCSRWSYKVREGLRIAAKHPGQFPELAKVAGAIRVVVLENAVVAEFKLATAVQPQTLPQGRAINFDSSN